MKLHYLILILLLASVSKAATYAGLIQLTPEKKVQFVDGKDHKTYSLLGNTPLLASHLLKLSTGDFISIEGLKQARTATLEITAIHYVGLARLLGTWFTTEYSQCYYFSTFNRLIVSNMTNGKCQESTESLFTYVINPASGAWVIMISGPHRATVIGEIKSVKERSAEIHLYNPETGDILRSINLRK